ncbi:39S ribosomal protein L38, mitochondrial-like isoform X2 [Polyodon spathula]|uniref:39S ribosomal protein L38, mitochondrial-like isoform X2 n=1 Tax=Polyodon spathula TaxID=7913 RepID=UPI001B7F3A52|nr:39S ribosomal protein L38, mitochondrial-like isoform X2 [Polyodon spathula]
MAAPLIRGVTLRVRAEFRVTWIYRGFGTSATCCRRVAPLGPMPNMDIDMKNLDDLEKYRSYTRYLKVAGEESRKVHWWKTYRQYLNQDEVSIPLDEVKAEWERTSGPYDIQKVAEHYGVYQDLFHGATFVPRIVLRVQYSLDEEHSLPVHRGNVVTPFEATSQPEVTFEAEESSLWTLLLTNPDGHLRDNDAEYVHWIVGNIPGNAVQSGEQICHYLPPFPAKGTGYHRFIFILFKQERPIDFTEDCLPSPCHSLESRTFQTFDFYRKHQDHMTPAGLAFFQSQWDNSVTHTFHQLLNMKEPVFEYDRPPVYHPPQKKYPHGEPVRYLDRYRDSQETTYGIY